MPTYTPYSVNDLLSWVSTRVLVEPVVNTTLGTAVTAFSLATVTPASMAYIYNGAMLLVGSGANLEIIVASNVTTTTFQASFQFAHTAADPLYGATFSTGQPNNILFTQQEMMTYLGEALDDFMLKIRPLYTILQSAFLAGTPAYNYPDDAIRIERISRIDYGILGTAVPVANILTTIFPPTTQGISNGSNLLVGLSGSNFEVVVASNVTSTSFQATFQFTHAASDPLYPAGIRALWDVSVTSLDQNDPKWAGERGKPTKYYEDQLNVGQYGLAPLPSQGYLSFLWYSQRLAGIDSSGYGEGPYGAGPYGGVTLITTLGIPDPLAYIPYYGLLARVFRKDGEMRDPQRESYCQRRYDIGVEIVMRLLEALPVNAAPGPVEAQASA